MLDIVAAEGVDGVDGKKVLDFGCCDLRHVQALARLGANAVHAQAGYNLTAMCNNWEDVGNVVGPDGQQGNLEVIRGGALGPDDVKAKLSDDYRLITLRNLVHKPAANDSFGFEPWTQTGIAFKKEEFVGRLFELLAPSGLLLIYNVEVDPTPADNAFTRGEWESAGFKVIAFDQDDRGAALGIGLELGWDAKSSPLERTIRAKYTLLKRPND